MTTIEGGAPKRRSRDVHIDELVTTMDALVEWNRKVGRRMLALTAALAIVMLLGFSAVAYLFAQLHDSRHDALMAQCFRTNGENQALIDFVAKVDPELAPVARERFPIEANCDAYANGILNGHDS